MVTRNIAKVAATAVTKRAVAIASLHSTENANSNVYDGVGKVPSIDPLKGKSIQELKLSPFFEVEDYNNSKSSPSSTRKATLTKSEAKSSPTVIMPAMMVGAVNFKQDFASMKATLERLSKESVKKCTH